MSDYPHVSSAYVPPRKRDRFFHRVVTESEVEGLLNLMERNGWEVEDPSLLEDPDSVTNERQFLIYASRSECRCDACRRSERRKKGS